MFAADNPDSSRRKRRKKKRKAGTGSVYRHVNKKWAGKITVPSWGGKRTLYRYGETKAEVEEALNVICQDVEQHPIKFYDPDPPNGNLNIYFVQGVKGGPIKIGLANDVERRVADLQVGSPVLLRVLYIIPGASKEMEQQLHQAFARHRLHGEWFKSGPINRYIKSKKQG